MRLLHFFMRFRFKAPVDSQNDPCSKVYTTATLFHGISLKSFRVLAERSMLNLAHATLLDDLSFKSSHGTASWSQTPNVSYRILVRSLAPATLSNEIPFKSPHGITSCQQIPNVPYRISMRSLASARLLKWISLKSSHGLTSRQQIPINRFQ